MLVIDREMDGMREVVSAGLMAWVAVRDGDYLAIYRRRR